MRISTVSDDDGAVDEGGLVGRHEHDQGYDVILTGTHSSERDGGLGMSVVLQMGNEGMIKTAILAIFNKNGYVQCWLIHWVTP